MPGSSALHCLPEFAQTDAIQSSHPLSSPSLPALSLSYLRVFSSESALYIRWLKYWSFNFSISLSNEYSGMDWLDLLAFQRTLKSLLHHNSKASIFWCSAFFMVHLSHLHMTTEKTIALTIRTWLANWCLCFWICCLELSAVLPRSKCLLISWLQSPSAVILDPKKIVLSLLPLFHLLFAFKWWDRMPWS